MTRTRLLVTLGVAVFAGASLFVVSPSLARQGFDFSNETRPDGSTIPTAVQWAIRPRRPEDSAEKQLAVTLLISTDPSGATVYLGRKRLGITPLTIPGKTLDTPMDITIRRKGYMTLHTRVDRRDYSSGKRRKRKYKFALTPAKL